MYHSYISNEDTVYDITNDMIFHKDEYYNLYNPKEILNVKSSEFDKEYNKFLSDEKVKEDSFLPVLALALNNKIKNNL